MQYLASRQQARHFVVDMYQETADVATIIAII